ncbi:MAG TPA: alkane 1-monooxygenase, partial [Steroidobacteraceae bacterium]|nr:alkane 1-monooxygenase [Steroidobacteraceae bacterium]
MLVRRLGFLLPLLLPVLVLVGYRLGGAWNFLTVAWTFAVVPLADALVGVDTEVAGPARGQSPAWDRFFDALLIGWVPVQFALLAFAVVAIGTIEGAAGQVGFTLSVGIVTGGLGITVAHELGHRQGRGAKLLAGALLSSVAYLHFYVEHNQGHHSRVGTHVDPATARPGEGFWRFLPRAVFGGIASAWHIEVTRLAKARRSRFSLRNRLLWAAAIPLAVVVLLGATLGPKAAGLFGAQALVAAALLELVNYVEHYGLMRRQSTGGGFERVGVEHSWNSSQRLSNWVTFNLQRHSHHHVQVTRRYQELEHAPDAPQLPTGYAGMIVLALVPPLW